MPLHRDRQARKPAARTQADRVDSNDGRERLFAEAQAIEDTIGKRRLRICVDCLHDDVEILALYAHRRSSFGLVVTIGIGSAETLHLADLHRTCTVQKIAACHLQLVAYTMIVDQHVDLKSGSLRSVR